MLGTRRLWLATLLGLLVAACAGTSTADLPLSPVPSAHQQVTPAETTPAPSLAVATPTLGASAPPPPSPAPTSVAPVVVATLTIAPAIVTTPTAPPRPIVSNTPTPQPRVGLAAKLTRAKFFRLASGQFTDFFIDIVAPPEAGGPLEVQLASRVRLNGVTVQTLQYGIGAMGGGYQFRTDPIPVGPYPIVIVLRTPIATTGLVEVTLLKVVLADGTSQALNFQGTLRCDQADSTQGPCEIR